MIILQLCRSLPIYPEAYLCSQEQAASEEAGELGQGRVHISRFWIEKARRKRQKKCVFLVAKPYGPVLG